MMRNKFVLLIAFVGASLIGHQYIFSEIPVWKVPKLMSSMRAKEFCTCRFILKNSTEYCLERVKKGYPLFIYEVDEGNREVLFSNYFTITKARAHEEPRYGCSIK